MFLSIFFDVFICFLVEWEERQDANGRSFYVNHLTRTIQWNRPDVQYVVSFYL